MRWPRRRNPSGAYGHFDRSVAKTPVFRGKGSRKRLIFQDLVLKGSKFYTKISETREKPLLSLLFS
jgi:hypothetical protein